MAATEPIRDKRQLQELARYWLKRGNLRNYALIVLSVCTALRISDLLRLAWEDVCDGKTGAFLSHITLIEGKTGKSKTIALNHQAIKALRLYFPHKRGAFIFVNNRANAAAISRVQAWRIIRDAADCIGAGRVSCHSLRKTFGYYAWQSGVPAVVIMDIYNHASYEVTRRYLGISQDDKDKVYLGLALF